MAVQIIYVLAGVGVSPNYWGNTQLNGTAPTAANTAYGWVPSRIALSTPYFRGRLGAATGATAAQAASYNAAASGPTPGTGTTNSTAGDSFRAGPFDGTFAATAWTFAWVLRATTAGAVGRVNMRVWRSANANGSSATQLLANTADATVTLSTTVDQNSSISWSPGALTLNDEYLFFQLEWQETVVGTTNGDNVYFRTNAARITTPDFAPAPATGTLAITEAADTIAAQARSVVAARLGSLYTGRASEATYFDASRNLQTAANDVQRFGYDQFTGSYLGTIIEAAGTNLIQNPRAEGAVDGVVGSGGAFPWYNWGVWGAGAGLTYTISNQRVVNNVPLIDIRFSGTMTDGGFMVMGFESTVTVGPNLPYAFSFDVAIAAGSTTNVGVLSNIRFSAGGGTNVDVTNQLRASPALIRTTNTGTTPAGNTWLGPCLLLTPTIGQPIDITLTLGLPQLELVSAATTYILPPVGVPGISTRAADVITLVEAGDTIDADGTVGFPSVTGALTATQAAQTVSASDINYLPNVWARRTAASLSGTGNPFTVTEDGSNHPDGHLLRDGINLPPGNYCLSFECRGVGPTPRGSCLDITWFTGPDSIYGIDIVVNPDGSLLEAAVWGSGEITPGAYSVVALGDGFFEARFHFSTSQPINAAEIHLFSGDQWVYQGQNDGSGIQFRKAALVADRVAALAATQAAQTLSAAGTVGDAAPSEPVYLVASFTAAGDRNNFTGQVGATFHADNTELLTFNRIGVRCAAAGNSGLHTVHLYDWPGNVQPVGTPLRTAQVDLTGGTPGTFYYVEIPEITLTHLNQYLLLREVTADGEYWADNSVVTLIGDLPVNTAYAFDIPLTVYEGAANYMYGGVDLALIGAEAPGDITGTLTATQASQLLAATGAVRVASALAAAQAAQTISATGGPVSRGTLTATQAAQIIAAAAGSVVRGTLTVSQAAQTISAAGTLRVDGTLAATEAVDAISAAGVVGNPPAIGTLVLTEAPDAIAAAGTARVGGALAATEAADTIVSVATLRVNGTLSIIEGADTIVAAGAIGAVPAIGTLVLTEAPDAIAAAGSVGIGGTLTASEIADAITAVGRVGIAGALTASEIADAITAAAVIGAAPVVGTLVRSEAPDSFASTGTVRVGGTLAVSEIADAITAAGVIGNAPAVGTLVRTEAPDTVASTGTVRLGGTLAVTEAADSIVGRVSVLVRGQLGLAEGPDVISATGGDPIPPRTGAIFGGALGLNINQMDSPLWVLNGYGDPMITSGYSILVELQAYNLTTSVVDTLRFGTEGYNDPSAPGYFSPRMTQSLNFRRDMFTGSTTSGAGRASFGEMRIANGDGSLDMLRSQYAFAGWPAKLLIGDTSLPFETFETLITGKPLQVFFSFTDLVVSLRDRLEDLQEPMQENNYKGDNVLPNGLEGGEDLKDKPKPLLFGRVQNVSPILINTAKLIYQVNDGLIEHLPVVYDQGVALTREIDYATSADMIGIQPGPGTFRCWMAGGCFRLGAMPVGTITCDAADKYVLSGTEVELSNTAAQVAVRILTHVGGITSGDINMQDVTHLDAMNSSAVGIWFADQTTRGRALDTILGSVGAWYGFDRFDQLRMRRHEVPTGGQGVCTFRMFGPTGLGDAAINDFDILDVRFLPTNDPDRGIPTWEFNVEWGLNYTVQQKDNIAGSVQLVRQSFLGLAVRTATASNEAIKTPYPLAKTKTITTVLLDGTAAQTEANRLLSIYQAQRDFIEIDTPLTSDLVATIDIGNEVFVVLPRFSFQTGKPFVIIGMQYNPGARGLTLMLWG